MGNTSSAFGALGDSRLQALRQRQQAATHPGTQAAVRIFEPKQQPILIKPAASSWEVLEKKLQQVINLPGLMTTVRELYDQGYGAELETAAEVAVATAKKSRFHLFAAMVSKKSGNWKTKTLQVVHATWEVRRNAREVIERLKLKTESTKAVLALAWRLKGTIIRFLGIALEQGTGIRNPAGVFFALTKKQLDAS
jgi:hypothetical protein